MANYKNNLKTLEDRYRTRWFHRLGVKPPDYRTMFYWRAHKMPTSTKNFYRTNSLRYACQTSTIHNPVRVQKLSGFIVSLFARPNSRSIGFSFLISIPSSFLSRSLVSLFTLLMLAPSLFHLGNKTFVSYS